MTLPQKSVTDTVTESVTVSRAHDLPKGRYVTVSRVTENSRDSDSSRDSDIAALELRNVTITSNAEERRNEKKRFAADPRFGLWAAGQKC